MHTPLAARHPGVDAKSAGEGRRTGGATEKKGGVDGGEAGPTRRLHKIMRHRDVATLAEPFRTMSLAGLRAHSCAHVDAVASTGGAHR